MARQGAHHCPFPHDIANNRPRLGVSLLRPSPNPRPLLDLMGLSDQKLQEQMARGHPYGFEIPKKEGLLDRVLAAMRLTKNVDDVKGPLYAFNMGSGRNISYQNYPEAARALMERNLPEVLLNKQTEVILLPESHLSKMPRVVDLQAYGAKKRRISNNELATVGLAKGYPECKR